MITDEFKSFHRIYMTCQCQHYKPNSRGEFYYQEYKFDSLNDMHPSNFHNPHRRAYHHAADLVREVRRVLSR